MHMYTDYLQYTYIANSHALGVMQSP